jgi:hypothetical protein
MLEPTVTQRVRAFLETEGVQLAPWTTLDETYGRLYELLTARRGDPAFWPSLGELIGELVADAKGEDGSPPLAELLHVAEIDRLVVDLERALPGKGQGRAKLTDFTASLALPALCGFLLLGLAAASGCSDSKGAVRAVPLPPTTPHAPLVLDTAKPAAVDVDAGVKGEEPHVDAAWFDGCALQKKSVLWRHIDRAELDDKDKEALCDCFAGLDKRWIGRLSYLFCNARPTEVAKVLEEMVACCEAEDRAADASCRDVAKIRNAVERRASVVQFVGAPMYKGVCFS